MDTARFTQRVANKETTIGIVGMGYVGLPLALTFAKHDFTVIGFDIDPEKITQLKAGKSYIRHISGDDIAHHINSKRLLPTGEFGQVSDCDAVLLCVPTPLNRNREPDMTYIEGTARAIGPYLKKDQLVVLESTTYPGTTDGLLRDILESISGLKAGEQFYLAFSPEREDPGNPTYNTQRIPKVVGGLSAGCRDVAVALYSAVLEQVVSVSSTRVAEMTKLLENIFRSVNIALVNELKMLSQAMDIDIWEVIHAAATKPFGYMPFYPGPGLGGHCIPIDPFYLTWKAREYEQPTRFIELAGEINTAMPHYVMERLVLGLNDQRKAVNGSRILVLGVAYKKDVDDMRESPALRVIELLLERGAQVDYHDPYIPKLPRTRHYHFDLTSVPLSDENLKNCDAVVVVTDHTQIDYARLVRLAPLVVDTRNATRGISNERHTIVQA